MTKIIGIANSCKDCPNRHYYSGGAYECMKVERSRLNADSSIPGWCPLPEYAAIEARPIRAEQTTQEDREAFERANGGELDRLPDGCYRKWSVENDFKLWTAALEYARKK